MKKKGIILGIIICCILVFSYFLGNDTSKNEKAADLDIPSATQTSEVNQACKKDDTKAEIPEKKEEVKESKKEETLEEKHTETEEVVSPAESLPAEESSSAEVIDENVCTLIVRCDSLLENPEKLSEGKRKILPENGIIFSRENISFSDGESVFDILVRELKAKSIHFEYVKNSMYNSVYIEGIGNIYEFDAGDLSGWLYKVNGEKPTCGCSQYIVQDGDRIEFIYSVNYLEEE